MNETRSISFAVAFGLIESLAFLLLFLSPALSPVVAPYVWLAIPLLRTVALLPLVFPSFAGARSPEQSLFRVLREGWPYRVPFWIASLLFPLQSGQAWLALCGLGLELGLLAALSLLTRGTTAPVGALTWLHLVTLAWLGLWRWEPWWLGCNAAVLVLMLRRGRRPPSGPALLEGQGLSTATVWLAVWALPLLTNSSWLSAPLSLWLALHCIALTLNQLQRDNDAHKEETFSAPNAGIAQAWLLRQRSRGEALACLGLATLGLPTLGEAWVIPLLGLAWLRGSYLMACERLRSGGLAWWVSLEFTLLWAAWHGPQPYGVLGALLGSVLLTLAVRPSSRASQALEEPHKKESFAELEQALRRQLRAVCPDGFATRVLQESASIEIEKDLTATAPAGFRQRLLDRLRQDQNLD